MDNPGCVKRAEDVDGLGIICGACGVMLKKASLHHPGRERPLS